MFDKSYNNRYTNLMNSKERVMTAVSHQEPDRTPMFLGRIDDFKVWEKYFGVKNGDELRTLLECDCRKTNYSGVYKTEPGMTVWGTDDDWEKGYNSAKIAPLAGALTTKDVENHKWPTLDDVDFDLLKERHYAMDDQYALICSLGFQPVFGTLNDLFGMEDSMIKMYTEPAQIEAAVEGIEKFLLDSIRGALEKCADKSEFFWVGDDFSTQRGMMISPELWRRFLGPTYRKIFELIKSFDVKVWFHSCGTFETVRPDLVDMGIDVWETVQAHLEGNEPDKLKNTFGKDVTFFGAVNCQQTLSFGTPADVRSEVRERIDILGKNGGLIIGPDHSIQGNMPPENIFALYDEAKKCC